MHDAPRGSGFATRAIHAGVQPTPSADAAPNGHAANWGFDQASSEFGLPTDPIDASNTHPTTALLEERIAALEGGTAALAVASGHAALLLAFHTLLQPDDEFVAARRLNPGSISQFTHAFKAFGWRVKWADADRPESFVEALSDRTKAIFIESIADPGGRVTDIEAIANVARRARVPLLVDNGLATPYLLRPFEHGADIVVHSRTNFLSGHGQATGGLIVDGGTFEWMQGARFPALSTPQELYDDRIIGETFGNFAFAVACRILGLRDLAPALAPTEAGLILNGIETLALRMQRHCDTALAVAKHLTQHPRVKWVRYAGLEDDPDHGLGRRYCPAGTGAGFTFGLVGGPEAGAALVKKLRLFSTTMATGGTRSSLMQCASGANVSAPDVVHVSVGLEDATDIIADLDAALDG